MKTTSITVLTAIAVLVFAGPGNSAGGFLDACSEIALTNLDGTGYRQMYLQANCAFPNGTKQWSELDLNHCFGWSTAVCGFTFKPIGGYFTMDVYSCDNHYTGGEEHFGSNFGCRGPCDDGGELYNVFALSKCTNASP